MLVAMYEKRVLEIIFALVRNILTEAKINIGVVKPDSSKLSALTRKFRIVVCS